MFNRNFRFETSFDDLWKHEKTTFRPIFIVTFVSFLLFALTFIVNATLALVYIESIKNYININSNIPNKELSINARLIGIIVNYAFGLTTLIVLGFMIASVVKGYRKKNFSKIYTWPVTVYFVILIFHIFQTVMTFFGLSNVIKSSGVAGYDQYNTIQLVFETLSTIILSLAYFIFIRKYVLIKFAYVNIQKMIDAQQQINENPELKELFKNIEQAFNMSGVSQSTFNFGTENTSEVKKEKADDEVSEQANQRKSNYEKLMNLPNEKIYNAAEKLYISGYRNMEKATLVNLILDILDRQKAKKEQEDTSVKENKKPDDEVVVEPKEPTFDLDKDNENNKKDEQN
ncbi:hypothetical protein [Mycoplasmopsis primatum]|uniref:hypothetical protein n=1 Tax=Mycoplasmopsis primatum TaxID=55604 RepID=UPI000497F344|nr:hypothetical protein [Mycoplasmopsis primatum]